MGLLMGVQLGSEHNSALGMQLLQRSERRDLESMARRKKLIVFRQESKSKFESVVSEPNRIEQGRVVNTSYFLPKRPLLN